MFLNGRSLLFALGLSLALLAGCSGNEENQVNDSVTAGVDSIPDSLNARYALLVRNIPAPLQVLEKLRGAKITFRKELPAPLTDAAFSQTHQQALNLGVQGADLAYAITIGELSDVSPRLRLVKKMADQLVVPTAFDDTMMQRYRDYGAIADSISKMVTDSYSRIDRSLVENRRVSLAALVVAGGWTESLYLATQHIGTEKENESNKLIYDIVREQKKHLPNLLLLLSDFGKDSFITGFAAQLKEIETVYPDLKNLSPETLSAMTEKIKTLRTNIIAGH